MPELFTIDQPLPAGTRTLSQTAPVQQSPITAAPVQQTAPQPASRPRQEPDAALDFFANQGPQPGGQVDPMAPEFQSERDNWYRTFVDGYHQQQFSSLDDYIGFVRQTVSSSAASSGIDSFIQKQALQGMPPELKAEMEERQQVRKQQRKFHQNLEMIASANAFADEKFGKGKYAYNAKNGSFEPQRSDLDFDRKFSMAKDLGDMYSKFSKIASDLKMEQGESRQAYQERKQFAQQNMADAAARYNEASNRLFSQDDQRSAPSSSESQEQQQILQAVQSGQMTREQAVAIARQKGWQ